MSAPHSDALVFFGATGDLAYKKIFPSLQAMVKRGHLDVPVIGVAKAGWNLDQLRARARDSLEKHGGVDPAAFEKLLGPAALRRRRLQRPGDVPGAPQGARRGAAAGALPRHPAGAVRDGRRAARRKSGCADGRARRSSRSRSAATSPRRRQLNRILLGTFDETRDLPHRPLPRQAAGAQHGVLPLRQRVPRAVLEPQLRRERADHDGRELRRPGPRRVLRRRPARSATWSRTTCSRSWRTSRWSRRRAPTASRCATRR